MLLWDGVGRPVYPQLPTTQCLSEGVRGQTGLVGTRLLRRERCCATAVPQGCTSTGLKALLALQGGKLCVSHFCCSLSSPQLEHTPFFFFFNLHLGHFMCWALCELLLSQLLAARGDLC